MAFKYLIGAYNKDVDKHFNRAYFKRTRGKLKESNFRKVIKNTFVMMRLMKHWNKLPRGVRCPIPESMLSTHWYHHVPSYGAVSSVFKTLSSSVTEQRAIQKTSHWVSDCLSKQTPTAIWDALMSLDWFVGAPHVSHKTYKRYSSLVQITIRIEHLRLYRAVIDMHLRQASDFPSRGGKHCLHRLHQQEEFKYLQCRKSCNQ